MSHTCVVAFVAAAARTASSLFVVHAAAESPEKTDDYKRRRQRRLLFILHDYNVPTETPRLDIFLLNFLDRLATIPEHLRLLPVTENVHYAAIATGTHYEIF